MDKTLGLYLHMPFCKNKCGYCDFYSVTDCKKCKRYLDIPKEEYKKLTDDFKPMKKLAKQCYKDVTRLCQNITVQSEESVNSVYMQIASQYPIASNENLKGQWMRAISDTIAYTIASKKSKIKFFSSRFRLFNFFLPSKILIISFSFNSVNDTSILNYIHFSQLVTHGCIKKSFMRKIK